MGRLFLGKPSISLTGFMFTGKSSVGKTLAARLGLKYVDLDEEIIGRAGSSIDKIFAERGEAEFRRLECETLASVLPVPGQVIATGGGVVREPENRRLLKKHSCVIWLKAKPQTILERFRNSRSRVVRPLLKVPDPEGEIIRLLAERDPWYRECDFSVDTDNLSVQAVSEQIIRQIVSNGEYKKAEA